jgi:hypothetical protein
VIGTPVNFGVFQSCFSENLPFKINHCTGRVYDARSVTVIPGNVNDPIVPECKKLQGFDFTDADVQKVKTLRHWWRDERRRKPNMVDSNGISQTMQSLMEGMHS